MTTIPSPLDDTARDEVTECMTAVGERAVVEDMVSRLGGLEQQHWIFTAQLVKH